VAVVLGGPGWVVLGVVKMLGGAVLAYLAITQMVPADRAVDPNQMYLAAWEYVFPHYGWAVAATALFLASDDSRYCTGGRYSVDGGMTAA
jgi:NAD(P)-dependent dehydrogenase (short-subunit alcohol dehydrogenase family)